MLLQVTHKEDFEWEEISYLMNWRSVLNSVDAKLCSFKYRQKDSRCQEAMRKLLGIEEENKVNIELDETVLNTRIDSRCKNELEIMNQKKIID